MNWKPLKEFNELPKNENFLIWDSKAGSGISIYEGMVYKGEVRCPATCDVYFSRDELGDFTHWCEIEWPTTKQENYTSEEQNQNHISKEWEEKFRWETAAKVFSAHITNQNIIGYNPNTGWSPVNCDYDYLLNSSVQITNQLVDELKKGRG